MRLVYAATTLFIVGACVGCAPYGGGASLPSSAGRHLQFKHPVSGVVGVQMTFPTSEGCAGMIQYVRWKPESKEMLPFIACVGTTISPPLPARATVRNKTYAFLLDIEAITLAECKAFVDGMMNSEGKENLEVAAACASR